MTDVSFERLCSIAGKEAVRREEPMRKHTSFRIGGPADCFITVKDPAVLTELVAFCRQEGLPYFILGRGTNLLVKDEGFIEDYKLVNDDAQGSILLTLKYGQNKERVITGLKRISKPGLRVYAKSSEVPKVLNGLGIAIISTSRGVMTDKEARKQNLGGEVLCYIW